MQTKTYQSEKPFEGKECHQFYQIKKHKNACPENFLMGLKLNQSKARSSTGVLLYLGINHVVMTGDTMYPFHGVVIISDNNKHSTSPTITVIMQKEL